MVDNLARTAQSPGANLPAFIDERMKAVGVKRPSLRQLALGARVSDTTLHHNLSGKTSMSVPTAKRVADFLECSVDELIDNVKQLVSEESK